MKILLLSHGNLARELLAAARTIAGELPDFEALPLDWSQGSEEIRRHISETLAEIDDGSGVLILADVFGATPCNAAMSFHDPGRVEVLGGVNLPMVVRLGCLAGKEFTLEEAARWLRDKGRSSIQASCDLQPRRPTSASPCDEPPRERASETVG
ncbi:MAG: PTS sugar transporter subunit IIA [Acidobacteriota bacterium]|nr:PTS sugar transporter subunit IIA [Acidobacteriota bacterium]